MATWFSGPGNDVHDALPDETTLYGGAGNDTSYGGAYNDTCLFTFNADGQDYISDSSGEYDTLNVGGVTNISGLEFHRATYYSSSNDSNDLVVQRVGDSAVSEFVYIDHYWSRTAPGAFLFQGGMLR